MGLFAYICVYIFTYASTNLVEVVGFLEMNEIENNIAIQGERESHSSSAGLMENGDCSSRASASPLPQVISALNRKLRRLELESKTLRREVEHLEKTHNALVVAEDTEQRLLARDPSLPVLRMPPDLIQQLSAQGSLLTEAGLEHEKIFHELKCLQDAADRASLAAQEAEREHEELADVLGGAGERGADPPAYAGLKAMNDQLHARRGLVELCLEREGLRTVLDVQNAELTKLVEELSQIDEAKKKKMELESEVAELLQQLSTMRLEKKQVESAIHRREWALVKPSVSLEESIREAIANRQVATAALDKLNKKGQTDEMSARCRANRILMLEKHLYLIADTISGGLDDAEPVHVDVFNAVMKEIAALRVLRLEGEAQATFLDQDIEDVNYRTNSIRHITLTTRKEKEKILRAHEKYMLVVGKDFEQQKAKHEEVVKRLREEVTALHRKKYPYMTHHSPGEPPTPPPTWPS